MNTDIFKQYAETRKEVERLKEVEESLRVLVLQEMQERKVIKQESEYGKFTIGSRKSWEYSPKVEALEEKVKLAKYKEQEKNIAKCKESHYLVLKPMIFKLKVPVTTCVDCCRGYIRTQGIGQETCISCQRIEYNKFILDNAEEIERLSKINNNNRRFLGESTYAVLYEDLYNPLLDF